MAISERVYNFLAQHKPDCFCDDCIQHALGLSRRQEVAPVTITLGLTAAFHRGSGQCALCQHQRTKLVIQAL